MLTLAEMTREAGSSATLRRLMETHLRERLGLEAEVRRLNRERSLTRFENQLLNEIVQRDDASSAAEALLRRLVPQPSQSFAALVDVSQIDVSQTPFRLIASRGLPDSMGETLAIPNQIVERLRVEPWLFVHDESDASDRVHDTLCPEATPPASCRGFNGFCATGPLSASSAKAVEPLGQAQGRLQTASCATSHFFANLAASVHRTTGDVWLIRISDGSELVAVLVTSSLWPAAVPRGEQLDLLSRVGQTLARLILRDRVRKRRDDELHASREMLALRTVTDRATDRPLETLGRFATRLREAVAVDRAAVFLLSRRTEDVSEPVVSSGAPLPASIESTWRRHESKLAWHAMTHQRGGGFDSSRLRPLGIDTLLGSAAAWPLIHEERLLGAIVLTRASNHSLADSQYRLLEWSADLLAGTLRRVFDEAAIRRQARHDGLTDLTNRRTFDTLLAGEIDRVRLGLSSECSLLLADLDRFKLINDTHGHPAGDEVLRVVAQLLREHVGRMRAGERSVLARYGGEELAVLLPGVGLAGAMRLAEEIRLAVEQRAIPFQNTSLGVTISIGAASCPRHAMTPADIVSAADQALYRAKSEGRNRVCQPGEA